MEQNRWRFFRDALSAHAVPGALSLKAAAFLTLALNGWSDGRNHFSALIIVLVSTAALLFCLHIAAIRSREARRLAVLENRRFRRAESESSDGRSRLRSAGQFQQERDRDAARLRAACDQRRDALLQERARLETEQETLKSQFQITLERFKEEVATLRHRSVRGFRTALADLKAIAALRHRLQPRVFGVRFNREHSLKITKDAEKEFLEAVDELITSNQPKTSKSNEYTDKN